MNRNVNDGFSYNAATDLVPLFGGKGAGKIFTEKLCASVGCTEEELLDAAANHVFEGYAFIDNEKLGDITRLEGFLYPDTYNFYVGGRATTALETLIKTFNKKIYSNDDQIAIMLNRGRSEQDNMAFEKMQEWRDWAGSLAKKIITLR